MNFLIPSTYWNENKLLFENVHSPCKLRCFDISFIRTDRCIERQIIIKDHQHVGETCIIIIKKFKCLNLSAKKTINYLGKTKTSPI